MASTSTRSPVDRMLGAFADVHGGEGVAALLLSLNIFLILMAYYVLKPVREALILGEGSAEFEVVHVGWPGRAARVRDPFRTAGWSHDSSASVSSTS